MGAFDIELQWASPTLVSCSGALRALAEPTPTVAAVATVASALAAVAPDASNLSAYLAANGVPDLAVLSSPALTNLSVPLIQRLAYGVFGAAAGAPHLAHLRLPEELVQGHGHVYGDSAGRSAGRIV